jgi:hypothetical protein
MAQGQKVAQKRCSEKIAPSSVLILNDPPVRHYEEKAEEQRGL